MVTGSQNETVLNTAALYLKVNTLFYFAPAAIYLENSLQGMGDHVTPICSSMIELAGKIIAAFPSLCHRIKLIAGIPTNAKNIKLRYNNPSIFVLLS